MDDDELKDIVFLAGILYPILCAIVTYPAIVAGYCFDHLYGMDAGFWAWLISIGILGFLKMIRAVWLLILIYAVSFIPFIIIANQFMKDVYGG